MRKAISLLIAAVVVMELVTIAAEVAAMEIARVHALTAALVTARIAYIKEVNMSILYDEVVNSLEEIQESFAQSREDIAESHDSHGCGGTCAGSCEGDCLGSCIDCCTGSCVNGVDSDSLYY